MAARTRRIPVVRKRRSPRRPARPRAPRKTARRPRAARPALVPAPPPTPPPLPRSVRFISTVFLVAGFASLLAVVLGTLLVSHGIGFGGDERLRLGLAAGAAFAVPFNGLAIAAGADLVRRARWAWFAALVLSAVGLFLVLLGTFGSVLSENWTTAQDLGPSWFHAVAIMAGFVAAAFFGWALLALSEPGTAGLFQGKKPEYQ